MIDEGKLRRVDKELRLLSGRLLLLLDVAEAAEGVIRYKGDKVSMEKLANALNELGEFPSG